MLLGRHVEKELAYEGAVLSCGQVSIWFVRRQICADLQSTCISDMQSPAHAFEQVIQDRATPESGMFLNTVCGQERKLTPATNGACLMRSPQTDLERR
jgi:hypothetical protein